MGGEIRVRACLVLSKLARFEDFFKNVHVLKIIKALKDVSDDDAFNVSDKCNHAIVRLIPYLSWDDLVNLGVAYPFDLLMYGVANGSDEFLFDCISMVHGLLPEYRSHCPEELDQNIKSDIFQSELSERLESCHDQSMQAMIQGLLQQDIVTGSS